MQIYENQCSFRNTLPGHDRKQGFLELPPLQAGLEPLELLQQRKRWLKQLQFEQRIIQQA